MIGSFDKSVREKVAALKRILFMHQVSVIGGASYCLLSLVKGLDKSKFEPVVMLRSEGPLADELRSLGIDVTFLPGMPTVPYNQSLLKIKTVSTYLKIERYQRRFADQLKQLQIDIVYLNNMMLYPYLKTAKKMGLKTIMHVREHWPENEHQHQMHRARYYASQYADSLIAINGYSASLFPECKDRITVIHDWIDLSERDEPHPFREIFGDDCDSVKVLLYTGGLAKIKGTLEIVRLFNEKITGPEYRLLMLGAGLDYKFQGLSGVIKKMLMVTGWKPYGYRVSTIMKSDSRIVTVPPTYKIVDYYRQAYCTVSYFTVPHANLALAEAVETGTVALAPHTEEAVEYSDHGMGAVLFEINNEADFINKFNDITEHYEEIKAEVSKHSNHIKSMFSPERNMMLLNNVCDKVCMK